MQNKSLNSGMKKGLLSILGASALALSGCNDGWNSIGFSKQPGSREAALGAGLGMLGSARGVPSAEVAGREMGAYGRSVAGRSQVEQRVEVNQNAPVSDGKIHYNYIHLLCTGVNPGLCRDPNEVDDSTEVIGWRNEKENEAVFGVNEEFLSIMRLRGLPRGTPINYEIYSPSVESNRMIGSGHFQIERDSDYSFVKLSVPEAGRMEIVWKIRNEKITSEPIYIVDK